MAIQFLLVLAYNHLKAYLNGRGLLVLAYNHLKVHLNGRDLLVLAYNHLKAHLNGRDLPKPERKLYCPRARLGSVENSRPVQAM